MVIKIQSISDVITNSSTEVYITYYSCDKNAVINVVNAILAITNSGKFEDYFEFEWIPNEELLYKKWEEDEIKIPFEEWLKTLSEYYLFTDYDNCYNFVDGYVIKAKDPKNKEAAYLLSTLDSIFTTNVNYD